MKIWDIMRVFRNEAKNVMTTDEKYMRAAIREARKAEALYEVPIGCVIVYEGKIIGRGYNRRMKDKNALAHAEITAIRKACKKMGDWRLEGCTIYITLEPCPMCAGAIVQARIPRAVIACMNPKAGCATTRPETMLGDTAVASRGRLQPPGGDRNRCARRRVLRHVKDIF